jgi:hypothetical protein
MISGSGRCAAVRPRLGLIAEFEPWRTRPNPHGTGTLMKRSLTFMSNLSNSTNAWGGSRRREKVLLETQQARRLSDQGMSQVRRKPTEPTPLTGLAVVARHPSQGVSRRPVCQPVGCQGFPRRSVGASPRVLDRIRYAMPSRPEIYETLGAGQWQQSADRFADMLFRV